MVNSIKTLLKYIRQVNPALIYPYKHYMQMDKDVAR